LSIDIFKAAISNSRNPKTSIVISGLYGYLNTALQYNLKAPTKNNQDLIYLTL